MDIYIDIAYDVNIASILQHYSRVYKKPLNIKKHIKEFI